MPTPLPLCNGHPSHDSMFLLPHQLFEPSTPTAFISSMSKVTHSPLTTCRRMSLTRRVDTAQNPPHQPIPSRKSASVTSHRSLGTLQPEPS